MTKNQFTGFFLAWTFLNFLARCVDLGEPSLPKVDCVKNTYNDVIYGVNHITTVHNSNNNNNNEKIVHLESVYRGGAKKFCNSNFFYLTGLL